MLKYCVDKWYKNKDKLEKAIRESTIMNDCEYIDLVKMVVEHIFNDEDNPKYYVDVTCLGRGDWQGTMFFVIQPIKGWEDDYLVTYADYGSCSVCDTLMGIQTGGSGEKLKESEVKDFMTLCLHLVQRIKAPYNKDKEFAEVEDIERE